jgi:hypothetical protein
VPVIGGRGEAAGLDILPSDASGALGFAANDLFAAQGDEGEIADGAADGGDMRSERDDSYKGESDNYFLG